MNVVNINDNPPVFEPMETNITIQEETVPTDCIFRVSLPIYEHRHGEHTHRHMLQLFVDFVYRLFCMTRGEPNIVIGICIWPCGFCHFAQAVRVIYQELGAVIQHELIFGVWNRRRKHVMEGVMEQNENVPLELY